jgi:hypothetical protein
MPRGANEGSTTREKGKWSKGGYSKHAAQRRLLGRHLEEEEDRAQARADVVEQRDEERREEEEAREVQSIVDRGKSAVDPKVTNAPVAPALVREGRTSLGKRKMPSVLMGTQLEMSTTRVQEGLQSDGDSYEDYVTKLNERHKMDRESEDYNKDFIRRAQVSMHVKDIAARIQKAARSPVSAPLVLNSKLVRMTALAEIAKSKEQIDQELRNKVLDRERLLKERIGDNSTLRYSFLTTPIQSLWSKSKFIIILLVMLLVMSFVFGARLLFAESASVQPGTEVWWINLVVLLLRNTVVQLEAAVILILACVLMLGLSLFASLSEKEEVTYVIDPAVVRIKEDLRTDSISLQNLKHEDPLVAPARVVREKFYSLGSVKFWSEKKEIQMEGGVSRELFAQIATSRNIGPGLEKDAVRMRLQQSANNFNTVNFNRYDTLRKSTIVQNTILAVYGKYIHDEMGRENIPFRDIQQ